MTTNQLAPQQPGKLTNNGSSSIPAMSMLNVNGAMNSLGPMFIQYKIQHKAKGSNKEGLITTPSGQREVVKMVIMAMSLSRAMWPRYNPNATNATPLCHSKNAVTPCGGTNPKPGPCRTCPASKWGNNSEPPQCAEQFNLLCYDIEAKMPFIFFVKRTAVAALKNLIKSIGLSAIQYGHPGIEPQCCMAISLSCSKVEGETYYLPVMKISGGLDIQQAQYCQRFGQAFMSSFQDYDPQFDDEQSPAQPVTNLPDEPPTQVTAGMSAEEYDATKPPFG